MLLMQAQNHRVRLWHATRHIYDRLADSTQYTESVHLFPGEAMLLCALLHSAAVAR